jgi:3-vinyl bacteriochlorophyllide hydratase
MSLAFFVIGLHTFYLLCLFNDLMSSQMLMVLALSAYFIYIVNALQFLLKLRMARLQHVPEFTHA